MSRKKSSYVEHDSGAAPPNGKHTSIHRQKESSVRGRYPQEQQHYLQREFTHDCFAYVREICEVASKWKHLQQLPVREALLSVCRVLLLNEFELLFLHSLLQGMRWEVEDELIVGSLAEMKKNSGRESPLRRKIELYLLLAAHSVKVYLNESTKIKMFEGELTELHPNFYKIFNDWVVKYAKNALTVNPRRLNMLYLDNSHREVKRKPIAYEDFNVKVALLVDSMPVPDPDSSYEVKEEAQSVSLHHEEYYQNEIQWEENRTNKGINDENMIEEMPMPAWPFRGDSVMSAISQAQNYWEQTDLNNLPMPLLTKRRSVESDLGLRIFSDQL